MSGPQPHRQDELLRFLRTEVERHGVPPSFSKMQMFLGLKSKSGVARLIYHLELRGMIRRLPRRANSIEILQTKNYHLPGCNCDACAQGRYIAQLKLIKGLKVDAPAAVANARLVGIRLLSQETRASLLGIPVNAAPHKRAALPREVG
jgi:SOS-response transcriptional repressor LexA